MHSDLTIVPGTAVASLYQLFSSLAVVFTDHELADLRACDPGRLLVSLFRAASAAAISDVASASSRPKEKHQQQSAVGAVCATRPI